MKERFEEIDISRGIVIVIVMIGHLVYAYSNNGYTPQYLLIYSFHMPFFFLISGYCLSFSKNYKMHMVIKKLLLRLILTMYIFRILLVALKIAVYNSKKEAVYEILFSPNLEWFCPTLFCTSLAIYIIMKFFDKRSIMFLSIIGIAIVPTFVIWFLQKGWHGFKYIPVQLDTFALCLSFSIIGCAVGKINSYNFLNKIKYMNKKVYLFIIVLGIAINILVCKNGYVNLYDASMGISYTLFFFAACFNSFLVVLFSTLLIKKFSSGGGAENIKTNKITWTIFFDSILWTWNYLSNVS